MTVSIPTTLLLDMDRQAARTRLRWASLAARASAGVVGNEIAFDGGRPPFFRKLGV